MLALSSKFIKSSCTELFHVFYCNDTKVDNLYKIVQYGNYVKDLIRK
jgi:hypothetical protein